MDLIKPLTELDVSASLTMFRAIFDEDEEPYFLIAWRSREIGLGVWSASRLIAAVIVCKNKLEYIFVGEPFRKLGIGSLLLKEVIRLKPALYLVPVQSPEVFTWYEKHGFHRDTRRDGTVLFVRYPYALRSKRASTPS